MSRSSSSGSDSSASHDRKRKRKSRKKSKSRSSKRMDRMESKLEDLTQLVTSFFGSKANPCSTPPHHAETLNIHDTKSLEMADEQSDKKSESNGNEESILQMGGEQPQDDTLEIAVLDEDIQKLLGDSTMGELKGHPLHPEIAKRWESITKQGVLKEERERIRKKFCLPPNCNIGAPGLNPELKTVNGFTKARDEEMRRIQGNIATAITGIGQTLTSVLDDATFLDRTELIGQLSDAGRFLTGTQYQISLFRRKEIKTTVRDSSMIEILNGSPIYPELFGTELSAKFKQATTLNKVGQDITKSIDKGPPPNSSKFQRKPEVRRSFKPSPSLNFNRPLRQSQPPKRSGRPQRKYP